MDGGSSSSSNTVYDVASERDVLTLLKLIRHSMLDDESKDEARDLIFSLHGAQTPEQLTELQMYVQPLGVSVKGGATEVDEADETVKTAEVETTPVESPIVAKTPAARSGFAGTRLAPSFGSQKMTAAPTASAPVTPAVAKPAPAPVTEAPEPVIAEEVTPEETTPVPEVTVEPETEAAAVVDTPPASPETPAPAADAAERIAEIKRIVNQKVGNPVHLIDATNEVGREYMNALLEAMKATQGGGNAAEAMARLETAFAAVNTSLDSAGAKEPSAQEEAPEEPVSTSGPEPVVESATPVEEVASPAPATTSAWDREPEEVNESETTPTTAVESTPASGNRLQSVASAAGDNKTTIPQPPEPEKPAAPADPLMNETVTNGLTQLLNEWKLFKAGGILGTGAKGVDHPLYKELRNLQMNLVIAGRFEGATPEVKQSIHDYMNGWRYEQGMTHDLKETFEHYLRRVVKTIIDKQQKAQ